MVSPSALRVAMAAVAPGQVQSLTDGEEAECHMEVLLPHGVAL